MENFMKKILTLITILFLSSQAKAEDTITNVTIYGNSAQTWNMPFYYYPNANLPGYAIISFAKQLSLNSGINEVVVSNTPDEMNASSVIIKNLGRGLQIVEQTYTDNRFSTAELLKKSLGKNIEIEKYSGDGVVTTRGVLVNASQGLTIKDGDKIKVVNDYSAISFPDLVLTDSVNNIKWLISSPKSLDSILEYSYKTSGISWSASYNVYVDGSGPDVLASVEGWANIVNATSIDIKSAGLKLVSGETNQVDSGANYDMAKRGGVEMMAMASSGAAMAPNMQQQKFGDYKIYTIDRKIDIAPTSSKKIKLFPTKDGVIARKKYLYDSAGGDNNVKSIVTFNNDERSRMGIPMPAGKYRVFAKDKSGEFEQIGEAVQDHKAEGEKVELTVGNSFDLRATRKQMSEERDELRRKTKYSVTVEIENALDKEVEVIVKEPIYQGGWSVLSANFDYKKIDVNTAEFTVRATAKETTILEYIVQYSW
jgi:hypothetical protein